MALTRRLRTALLAPLFLTPALLVVPLLSSVPTFGAAPPTDVVVPVAADTYVHGYAKTTNYGSSWSLGAYGTPDVQSLLRFTLPAAPAGQVLSTVALLIRTATNSSAGSADVQQVRFADNGWVESTVTYNTKPPVGGTVLGSLPGGSAVSTDYVVPLDVAAVSARLGTATSFAVLGTGSDSFWFTARESSTVAARPVLALRFVDATPPAPLVLATTPTADTYANAGAPNTNFGSSWTLLSRGSPGGVSYLRFVLPAAPPGRQLTGALLRFRTTTESTAGSTEAHTVRFASDSWAESTLTWNARPALTFGTLGTVAPGTVVDTPYDAALDAVALRPVLGTQISLGVTNTGTDSLLFWSRNHGNAGYRPQLVLSFEQADTTAPTAPAGLASAVAGADVTLSWSASTDNVGVTGYDVHRSRTPGFTPTPLTLVGTSASTSFADTARPAGTGHYRVTAHDAAGNTSESSNEAVASVSFAGSTTVMTVGDIACAPNSTVTTTTCRHGDVAGVVNAATPDHFLPLGDLQYPNGSYAQFTGTGAYDSAYGSLKSRTLPVLGNHEYTDPAGRGRGYFDYFYGVGVQQGPFGVRPEGYYARTVGPWQLVVLNSECAPEGGENANQFVTGGCAIDSPQYEWLRAVLATNTARCTIVATHRPRWSTGLHPPYDKLAPAWDLMAQAGVDVAVSGHNHSTEVFQRIGVSGGGSTPVLDPAGIRAFVAGGGGVNLRAFPPGSTAVTQALQARDSTTFGPLHLTLRASSFDWSFDPVPGQTFTGVGTTGAFNGSGETCS